MESARVKILRRLHHALNIQNTLPYADICDDDNIFDPAPEQLRLLFTEQFKNVGGHIVSCKDTTALITHFRQLIHTKDWKKLDCRDARLLHLFNQKKLTVFNQYSEASEGVSIAVTSCLQLIARTGSVVLSSVQAAGRQLSIAADIHIVVAFSSQLVYTIKEALIKIKERFDPIPSLITITTGPSRTADIEKTLVMGAHGPKELYIFLIET